MKKFINIITNNFYLCIFYIFTSFTFVTALKTVPYINVLPKIALVFGGLISIYNIYTILKRKPSLIEWCIFLFLFTTFILNLIIYFSIDNFKSWFINLILLCSIFFINKEKNATVLKKELFFISNFYILLTFIFSLLSLIIIIKQIPIVNFNVVGQGGFFENENALGISASISFIITIYAIIQMRSKKFLPIYILNIIIQLNIIITSDSRSSLIVFFSIVFVLILVLLKNTILKFLLVTLPCLVIIYIISFQETLFNALTTNRVNIWESAISVLKNNFLFGVGNSKLAESVITARPVYIPNGIYTGGLHNIYIQIFTTNGVFSFISFLLIIVLCLLYISSGISSLKSKEDIKTYFLLSIIVNILLINLFESTILYIISFISIILWTYLGYTLSITINKRDEI